MFGFLASPCSKCATKNANLHLEAETYRGFFCGLANRLQNDYGLAARMLVNRDAAFLSLFSAAQEEYEPDSVEQTCCNPFAKKRRLFQVSDHAGYAAAVTICGLSAKLDDDFDDSSRLRRPLFWVAGKMTDSMTKRAMSRLEKKEFPVEKVRRTLGRQVELERDISNGFTPIDQACYPTRFAFGEILAKSGSSGRNAREEARELGRNLGEAIYWLDAAVDFESDQKKHRFNPLPDSAERTKWVEEKLKANFNRMGEAISAIKLHRFRSVLESILLDLSPKKAFSTLAFASNGGGSRKKNKKQSSGLGGNNSSWTKWDCCEVPCHGFDCCDCMTSSDGSCSTCDSCEVCDACDCCPCDCA